MGGGGPPIFKKNPAIVPPIFQLGGFHGSHTPGPQHHIALDVSSGWPSLPWRCPRCLHLQPQRTPPPLSQEVRKCRQTLEALSTRAGAAPQAAQAAELEARVSALRLRLTETAGPPSSSSAADPPPATATAAAP